jgi:presequence protease
MTTTHGFELIRDEDIPELNSKARLYRHVKTGAQMLSMENDDENKVFGINFFTPPPDSTGLPHIMEHSVLCGSRKYPVKEPFVELIKSSLNTFLNAMTFPDKTCYPVASQNLRDFYNLIDVYLDAVFYPRITPHILQQEGWHYELEDANAPLAFKGVVFNEMKGAYSSPDNLFGRYIQQSLFPDNIYGHDSGGDPKVIPNLTYEQFKKYHETYYHPSNALIYFYGDDDPQERLRLLDAYLRDFDARPVERTIQPQPRFDKPQRITYPYDAGPDGAGSKKAMVTVNWLLDDTIDPERTLGFEILAYILIGTPASPLRKALIDSGLGEDLAGGGLDTDISTMYLSTGLKGIAVEDADKVEQLILKTVETLARDGIEQEMVEAAMNTIEFRLREKNTGNFPRGLFVMLAALTTWLYGSDPLAALAFEAPLQAIKDRLAAGERYFEGLIARYMVDNSHRTTVLLKPDPQLRAHEDAAEEDRLAKARAAAKEDELRQILENTKKLKELQITPDSPEALATIPTLTLSDLDKKNKLIPCELMEAQGSTLLYHDLFTNGIVYLDLGLNLHALPQVYLPYVGLFSQALLEMGTQKEDFVKLSQRIGRKTGGIRTASFASMPRNAGSSTAWLFLRGKATPAQADDLLAILRDVLLTVKLDNQERFRQIVLEEKAGHEAGLVPGGHGVAYTRLKAAFNEADWADEQMDGVSYLFFLRELADAVEKDWPSVLEKLETIRRTLLNRDMMIANVTLDGTNWSQFQPKLADFLASLPAGGSVATWSPSYAMSNEGLTIPAKVNYVAKGADLYKLGYKHHGSSAVVSNYLRTTWLWERVRVQGGAYGGFCIFDRHSGVFSFVSYRDPNLLGTLDNYDGAASFLRQAELSDQEVTRAIIGTIGDLDAYQLPDAKGYTSLLRYLTGETDESLQQRRDEILSTTAANFRAFGDVLSEVNRSGRVVVLGSQEDIQGANAARGANWLSVTKVL